MRPAGPAVSKRYAKNYTAATYTYDSHARVRTYTDSEGWSVTCDYAADRRELPSSYALLPKRVDISEDGKIRRVPP